MHSTENTVFGREKPSTEKTALHSKIRCSYEKHASMETPSYNEKTKYEPVTCQRSPLSTKNNIRYSKYGIHK